MHTETPHEELQVILGGLRLDDTLASASLRLPLSPSSLSGYYSVGQPGTFGPGIPYTIEARFAADGGPLECVLWSGFPCFPADGAVETWSTVVGPALNAWLSALGFTYDRSQRFQSDEQQGGVLGSLGEGDYDYFRSPAGVRVAVTVLWDEPQWTAEFRGPGAPDFENDA